MKIATIAVVALVTVSLVTFVVQILANSYFGVAIDWKFNALFSVSCVVALLVIFFVGLSFHDS